MEGEGDGEEAGGESCDNKHIHFYNIAHAPIGTIDMSMNYMYIYSDEESTVCILVCVCACATSGSCHYYYDYIYTRPNLPLYKAQASVYLYTHSQIEQNGIKAKTNTGGPAYVN